MSLGVHLHSEKRAWRETPTHPMLPLVDVIPKHQRGAWVGENVAIAGPPSPQPIVSGTS